MTAEQEIRTLGTRLAEIARQLELRHVPRVPWAGPLTELLEHVAALPAPADGRYARIEGPVGAVDLATPAAGRRPDAESAGAGPAGLRTRPSEPPAEVGLPIPPDVRFRLDQLLEGGAEVARVHTDDVADRIARAQQADAVTVGREIYFRAGAYQPRDDRGFGLLAHETRHVLGASQPGAAERRSTGRGVAEEEAAADLAERTARSLVPPGVAADLAERTARGLAPYEAAPPGPGLPHPPSAPLVPPTLPASRPAGPTVPSPSAISQPAAAAVGRPMAAPAGRDLDQPTTPPALPQLDLEALRRTLYRGLMQQIRTDFERGG
jgi:hypothetical protein